MYIDLQNSTKVSISYIGMESFENIELGRAPQVSISYIGMEREVYNLLGGSMYSINLLYRYGKYKKW